MEHPDRTEHQDDRRSFLKKAGTFAAVTPPAITFLLSTTMSSQAIAASGGAGSSKPGWGFGDKNHDHSGPPGLTDKDDKMTGKKPKGH